MGMFSLRQKVHRLHTSDLRTLTNSKRQAVRHVEGLQYACCVAGGAPTPSAPLLPSSALAPGGRGIGTGAPGGPGAGPAPSGAPGGPGAAPAPSGAPGRPGAGPAPPGAPGTPGTATATATANVDSVIREGSPAAPPSKSKSGLPLVAIVGGGIGAVVLLAVVMLIIFRNKLCGSGQSHGSGQVYLVGPPKTYTNPMARLPVSARKLFESCFSCGVCVCICCLVLPLGQGLLAWLFAGFVCSARAFPVQVPVLID
jgi:hypothetical protein